jgi:hypothetical protein
MNYLTYPTKTMSITQSYTGTYSHKKHYEGTPQAFPIDEAGEDSGRSYFLCPCDEVEIKRIYGVGTGGTNTIWLQSTSKVVTPTFTDYVTIMVIHPNDDDLSKLKVGQKFTRGQEMFREGTDGNATGNHFHFSVAQSLFKDLPNKGWVENDKGAWVLPKNNRKPEECFYIDNTKIKSSKDLKFLPIPKCENCEELKKEIVVLEDKIALLEKEVQTLQDKNNLLEKENAALKDYKFSFTATQDGFVKIKMYKDEELRIY